MRIRFNRWQQIGVVLSVLAFVGIGIYAWVFEARHRDSFYITQFTMCYNTLRTQNDALQGLGTQEDRAEREAANQAEYGQCMNEADATLRATTDANLKRMPIFLATVLGLIVIAWLIELLVVEIARWIMTEFAEIAAHSSLDHNELFLGIVFSSRRLVKCISIVSRCSAYRSAKKSFPEQIHDS